MAIQTMTVNGKAYSVDTDPNTPLLWVLRDSLALTGTKFSCGAGLCGAWKPYLADHAVNTEN